MGFMKCYKNVYKHIEYKENLSSKFKVPKVGQILSKFCAAIMAAIEEQL